MSLHSFGDALQSASTARKSEAASDQAVADAEDARTSRTRGWRRGRATSSARGSEVEAVAVGRASPSVPGPVDRRLPERHVAARSDTPRSGVRVAGIGCQDAGLGSGSVSGEHLLDPDGSVGRASSNFGNSVPSRVLVPMISGTRCAEPSANASSGWRGRKSPSTTGPNGCSARRLRQHLRAEAIAGAAQGVDGSTSASASRPGVGRSRGSRRTSDAQAGGRSAWRPDQGPNSPRWHRANRPFAARGRHQGGDGGGSGGFAEERDVVRIATECGDIALHPFAGPRPDRAVRGWNRKFSRGWRTG